MGNLPEIVSCGSPDTAMPGDAWRDLSDLPTHASWQTLRELFTSTVRHEFGSYMSPQQPNFTSQLSFATGRFDEGAALLRYFLRHRLFTGDQRVTILDIGAGNGGIAFAFANVRTSQVHTLDLVPNVNLLAVRNVLPVPIFPAVGDGSELPFKSGQFHIVLLLDTLEHVARPRKLALEVMRILKSGGVCVITTPARLRHVFGRDPHYGVPGLVALPIRLQRFIVDDILRRRFHTPSGGRGRAYDVTHLYWNVREIAELFPPPKEVEVLYNRTYTPPGKFTAEWLRHPSHAIEQLRFNAREYFFDRILVWKGTQPAV